MTFTSTIFLFIYLPIALVAYHISADRFKEIILILLSFLFYALLSPKHFVVFVSVVFFTVLAGRSFKLLKNDSAKKALFFTSVILLITLFFFFKYIGKLAGLSVFSNVFDKSVASIIMPIGISFYIFRSISYLADSYKGLIDTSYSLAHDILYLSFFPQIISGPITRYNEFGNPKDPGSSRCRFQTGITRFMTGFAKKILIADILARISAEVFSTPFEKYSISYAWLGSICFSLQLLFDFSSYSDMAIGLSAMFGYGCKENFDHPYMTRSVSEFWRRWHISLGEWFKDYVYFPLGGSKNKYRIRTYLNLFIVWLLTGIWHGSSLNYIIWGMANFAAISFERITQIPKKLTGRVSGTVYRILALIYINFTMVIFNSESLVNARHYLRRMVFCSPCQLADQRTIFLLKDNSVIILTAVILCFPVSSLIAKKYADRIKMISVYNLITGIIITVGFIISISLVVSGQNNPFAYMGF